VITDTNMSAAADDAFAKTSESCRSF